ncbi:GAF and ANTAR domain-containing protein [Micromonospora sp. NBC_01796]|uniref:GAF and ANTAR domain-containing protein n=1 Tax=Micromonospora sp. NBC_01796 TaxID=2975987 RepID=UPI002DD93CC3|nr:GAF and ANTAR domain-containing protein [Micromonospora sp. NBC_01796]WSA87271.1 GAF and ANTAR domain-containing protein [Micromonospora sp. NBC_01796]
MTANHPAGRWVRALSTIAQQEAPDNGADNVAKSLSRICRAAAHELGGSGAGVTVLSEQGGRGFAAASDETAYMLEELQFTLGEGPCIDAYETRRPVLVPDLTADTALRRWPVYAPAVREHDIRAVFALPLQVGALHLGALDLFRHQTGPLTKDAFDQALTFAEIALTVVLDGQGTTTGRTLPVGFDQSPGFRAEVAQAQGMIMVQLGVTIEEALIRLRAHAYAEGRPLHHVAQDVVDRKLRFDQTQE